MYNQTRHNISLRLIRPLLHFIMILCVFFFIFRLRFFTDLIPWIQLQIPWLDLKETMIYAVIAGIVFIGIGIIKWLYELEKPVQKHTRTLSKTRFYRLITITFIAYFWQWFIFKSWISRFVIVFSTIISFVVIFIFDRLRNSLEAKIHREWWNRILIIWNDAFDSSAIIEKVRKWFSFKSEFIKFSDVWDIDISKYFIVIAAWSFPKEVLQELFERVRFSNTRFFHIGEWFFLEDVVYSPENIDDIMAFEYKHSHLDWRFVILKRLFDIFVSFFALILLIPIFIVVSIIIKIDSRWPVFYTHRRVWKNGRLFTFIKFRSMYKDLCVGEKYWWEKAMDYRQELINSDQNIRKWALQKIDHDPRVTRFWKILRKTSIDELPNLFCVLIWTMSLVWPRPHLPNEIEKYKPRQKRLLSIKPWITWYAQIFGRHNISFDDEARLDLHYIQKRSIFLDTYIIFSTFKIIFKGD